MLSEWTRVTERTSPAPDPPDIWLCEHPREAIAHIITKISIEAARSRNAA